MRVRPSASRSRRQTTAPVAGGQIRDRVLTHTPSHGEPGGSGTRCKERCKTNEKRGLEAHMGVACRTILVCDCVAFCLPVLDDENSFGS